MATLQWVKIEPLTDEAFAPFGQIISAQDRAPDFHTTSGTRGWAVDFQAGRPLLMLLHTPYQGLSFGKLERHFNLTQTFLPMGGSPAVVAVAPPGSGDRNEVPAPSDVRAFLLDGSRGYLLGRGCGTVSTGTRSIPRPVSGSSSPIARHRRTSPAPMPVSMPCDSRRRSISPLASA